MVIVDSSVWIEYFRGTKHPETEWLDRELHRQPLGITDLILCEVLQGTSDSAVQKVQSELLRLNIFQNCSLPLAVAAAHNYRVLRRRG